MSFVSFLGEKMKNSKWRPWNLDLGLEMIAPACRTFFENGLNTTFHICICISYIGIYVENIMFYAVTERFFGKYIFLRCWIVNDPISRLSGIFPPKNGRNERKKEISKKSLCHGVSSCQMHNLAKWNQKS